MSMKQTSLYISQSVAKTDFPRQLKKVYKIFFNTHTLRKKWFLDNMSLKIIKSVMQRTLTKTLHTSDCSNFPLIN